MVNILPILLYVTIRTDRVAIGNSYEEFNDIYNLKPIEKYYYFSHLNTIQPSWITEKDIITTFDFTISTNNNFDEIIKRKEEILRDLILKTEMGEYDRHHPFNYNNIKSQLRQQIAQLKNIKKSKRIFDKDGHQITNTFDFVTSVLKNFPNYKLHGKTDNLFLVLTH